LGIFVKQLHVRERTEKSYEHIKEKIEELWYSRRDAGSDLKSMASSLPSSQNINNPSNI
jgi:prefoldin subunit 5